VTAMVPTWHGFAAGLSIVRFLVLLGHCVEEQKIRTWLAMVRAQRVA
jgi:hypothetical protein